jgi:hypothetical protein
MCGLPENPYHPFVIHFFNEQDGGFHAGDYCKDRASAEEAYTKRALRFMSFKQE